jgi:hypothetical protein
MPETRTAPPRKLGLFTATALVVGNMIGSGVFLLPSALAAYGGVSIVAWLFTSAGALLLALVFARLGRAYPRTGGPYAYGGPARVRHRGRPTDPRDHPGGFDGAQGRGGVRLRRGGRGIAGIGALSDAADVLTGAAGTQIRRAGRTALAGPV